MIEKTKEELEKELKDWQTRQFMNQMSDHWCAEDYAFDRKCNEVIAGLKKQLEELEKGE